MAKIGPVLLDIQKVPNNLAADVEVVYTVTFDESDVSTNRRYDEVVELIGSTTARSTRATRSSASGRAGCRSTAARSAPTAARPGK